MKRENIIIWTGLVLFLAIMYWYINIGSGSLKGTLFPTVSGSLSEDFAGEKGCPDLLVRKNNTLLLYNTKDPSFEPIPFYNLDEYINYLEIQRNRGTVCPVLFLQYESTAQGTDVYRMRPSPFDLQGGVPDLTAISNTINNGQPVKILDANRDGAYNQNMFAGFDPYGLHTGQKTELDTIHESTANAPESVNPMDFNWGGVQVTENAVRAGYYADRYVSKPQLFTPKTTFLPDIYGAGQRPPNEIPDALKAQPE